MEVQILTGIIAGVSYALTGYGKNKGAEFNPLVFGRTILLGAATGALMGFSGIDLEAGHQLLVNAGAVVLIENGLKIVWRRILPWFNGIREKFSLNLNRF